MSLAGAGPRVQAKGGALRIDPGEDGALPPSERSGVRGSQARAADVAAPVVDHPSLRVLLRVPVAAPIAQEVGQGRDRQRTPLWQRALTLVGLVSALALAGLLVVGVVSYLAAGHLPVPERVASDDLVLGRTASSEQALPDPPFQWSPTGTEPVEESGAASAAGGSSGVVAGGELAPAEPGAAREPTAGSPPSAAASPPPSANGAGRPRAGERSPPAEAPLLQPVAPVPWLPALTPSAGGCC